MALEIAVTVIPDKCGVFFFNCKRNFCNQVSFYLRNYYLLKDSDLICAGVVAIPFYGNWGHRKHILYWRWKHHIPPNQWYTCTRLHIITGFIFTAVKSSLKYTATCLSRKGRGVRAAPWAGVQYVAGVTQCKSATILFTFQRLILFVILAHYLGFNIFAAELRICYMLQASSCLVYCSTPKMEALCFSETPVDFHRTVKVIPLLN